jgi:hypothetical protein
MLFLCPTWFKLLVVAVRIFLAWAAGIQGWVFGKEYLSKPALYDLLEPFPFWEIYVLIALPLFWLTILLEWAGLSFLLDVPWFWFMLNAMYFYIVACGIECFTRLAVGQERALAERSVER